MGTAAKRTRENRTITVDSLAAKGEGKTRNDGGHSGCPSPDRGRHLPEAASVFDAASALDTALDMVDLQPTLVELLVSHVLLPRERLPQIEIHSNEMSSGYPMLNLRLWNPI